MGRAKVVRSPESFSYGELRREGLDSVYAPTGPGGGDAEYVVYNHSQVHVQSITRM